MTILVQHGWGKSDKIERGIANGSVRGVIVSPRDEKPDNLASFLSAIQDSYPDSERLADPQLYAGTIWPVRDGNLPKYAHYRPRLTPVSFSPAGIRDLVTAALDWQYELDVSAVLSPTVMVDDFGSRWAQIAMMCAQETIAQFNNGKPLLISLLVGEDALRQRVPVDDWLDNLTQLDVDGFYLIVRRASEGYRQHFDPEVLASLLRVCYSLAELNQYRVYVGYTDMVTLMLHAVGVAGTGSGWFAGLRQFSWRRFQPVSGGRQPRPRYSSLALLNSIYITELDGIYSRGHVSNVLSGTSFDVRFNRRTNPENVPWPPDEAALHHWQVLAGISRVPTSPGIVDRLDSARDLIAQAHATYARIGSLVPFTTETGPTHLDQWLDALNRFRSDLGV